MGENAAVRPTAVAGASVTCSMMDAMLNPIMR